MTGDPASFGRILLRTVIASVLAILPLAVGAVVDTANGVDLRPGIVDEAQMQWTVFGDLAVLVSALALAVPVAVVLLLLERAARRVYLSRWGRILATVVLTALVSAGAGLLLGGLVAPNWRPLDRSLVFIAPWSIAATALLLVDVAVAGRRHRRVETRASTAEHREGRPEGR